MQQEDGAKRLLICETSSQFMTCPLVPHLKCVNNIYLIICFEICSLTTLTSIYCMSALSTVTSLVIRSSGYLSSSAFIWKASSSQSSNLWVNSLTSCCWTEHRHPYKISTYRTAFDTQRSQGQTIRLNSAYEQEGPITQINAMSW